jgi:DNA polymerase III subunit epsilon
VKIGKPLIKIKFLFRPLQYIMKLNLKRPLAFFDLETTGTMIGLDRIVEISILKAKPDGTEEIKTLRLNPQMPIPLESSLIHGIYDEDIKDAPTFKEVAQELADFFDDSDLAGYNSNKFDIPMLLEEFLRADIDFDLEHRHFVDVQNIFHQMEQRTLKAAYKFYCDKTIENAHSAEADIKATYEVFLAQLERYKDVEWEDKKGNKSVPVQNDVEALHAFTNLHKPVDFAGRMVFNDKGEELFNFGKHKGKRVEDVFHAEPSYYAWMQQGDFPLYTKKCLERIWVRWNEKKVVVKKQVETTLVFERRPDPSYQRQQPAKKEKAEPITNDMLEQLKLKFGK